MNKSVLLVLLLGVVLAQAKSQWREVNDLEQEATTPASSSGEEVDEGRRHHHHHHGHHHRHHHHHRRHHHHPRHENQLEEMQAFERFIFRYLRAVANESGLNAENTDKLMQIVAENRPELRAEDRSEWTEQQWQQEKELKEKRRELIQKQAYEKIADHEHLRAFFARLDADKKAFKQRSEKAVVDSLIKIGRESGLNDTQIERFLIEMANHEAKNIHWRVGMSANEKRKNFELLNKNWEEIKAATLKHATSEEEQAQYELFFRSVERHFRKAIHDAERRRYRNRGFRSHEEHHRHHHRHSHRRFHDSEEESDEEFPPSHHHRRPHHHRRHHHHDDDDDEDSDDDEHRPSHHHRRHHHHRRPHHHDDDEDSNEDDFPEHHRHHHHHHHRRHHHHHHRRPHHDDDEDFSGEMSDEESRPRHHHHHHHHHRRPHHHHDEDDEELEEERRPRHHHHHRRHHHHKRWDNSAEE